MANEFKVRKGLVVNGSGSVILDVQGSQGQLFSVTDQLSGSLFSVNDISGVPVLEAFSDSTVKIGQYLSEAIVVSGSTARITGSIAMAGFSSGSVLFAGPGGSITQNNANFFWDNVNGRLGIGTNAPVYNLDITGNVRIGNSTNGFIFNSNTISTFGNIFLTVQSDRVFSITDSSANNVYFRVIRNTGNVLVNSTTDTGERFQVSGSSRFVGSSLISGSLLVTNVSTGYIIEARNNSGNSGGFNVVGNNVEVFALNAIVGFVGSRGSLDLRGYSGGSTGNITTPAATIADSFNYNASSTNTSVLRISPAINQTGTAGYTLLDLIPTINTTGSGISYYIKAPNFNVLSTGDTQISGSARITNGLVVTGSTTIVGDVSTGNTVTIGGATGGAGILSFFNGNVGISRSGASGLNFRVGSNAIAATITQDRLVGIGTESPATLLHVTGSNQGLFLVGGTAGSNILYVSSSGNVGIGTNTPEEIFTIQASSPVLRIRENSSTSTNTPTIRILNSANNQSNIYLHQSNYTSVNRAKAGQLNITNNGAGGIVLGATSTDSTATIDFVTQGFPSAFASILSARITNGGNFLMGFTSDSGERLQVSGSAKITDGLSVTGSITANSITVTGTLTAQTIVAQTITSSILYSSGSNIFGNNLSNTQDFTGSVRITGSLQLTGDTILRGSGNTSATSALTVQNSSATNLFRVNNDGNVGIGFTGSLVYKLELEGGNFRISNPGLTQQLGFGYSGGSFNFIGSLTNTPLHFYVNSTARAVLSTTGNLLIGITSDDGVNRLQVSGSSRFIGDMVITGSANITQALTASAALISGSGNSTLLFAMSPISSNIFSISGSGQVNIGSAFAGTQQYFNVYYGALFQEAVGDANKIYIGNNSSLATTDGRLLITPNRIKLNDNSGTLTISADNLNTGASISINARNADSGSLSLVANNTEAFKIFGATRNVAIQNGGTFTDDTINRLQVSGSAKITQALTSSTALISGSGTQRLTIVGSGSAQPLFTVQGSQGELFSIVDSLSGSLFSVNDQSGLPIMEVFSDNTILMGNYLDPMLLTTARTSSAAGINTLYTLPTSSYDAVYIDYTIRSGSNARAGNFMAMWSGTSVNFTDNSITEFGTTSGFVFGAHISGSNMVVTGSSSTAGWTVKTIIKAI